MDQDHDFAVTPQDGDLDIAHLRERYSFIGQILSRFELSRSGDPAESREIVDTATRRYHQARMNSRIAHLGPEDMPGWRAAVLMRDRRDFFFAGVRDDGSISQGKTMGWRDTERMDPAEIGRRAGAAFDTIRNRGTRTTGEIFDDPGRDDTPDEVYETEWLTLSPRSSKTRDRALSAATRAADSVSHALLDHPAANQVYSIVLGTLRTREARRVGSLSAHLMKSLDPEVQHLVRSTATYETAFADWLSGTPARHGDDRDRGDLARNRRQAVRAYPLLALDFMQGSTRVARGDAVATAIDEGAELSRPLADVYGLSPAALRRLQGVTWQKAGRDAYRNTRRFTRDVAAIDPNHIPDSRRGFADLRAAADAAQEFAGLTGADAREVLAEQGGRIGAVGAALEGNPATGMADMQGYIREKVLLPGIAQRLHAEGADREAAAEGAEAATQWYAGLDTEELKSRSLVRGHSLRSALTASARWHRALPRLEAGIVTDGSQDRWDPLTSGFVTKDGVEAVELASTLDLKREGVAQNHCVGGYSEEVKGGSALIFSLRKGDKTLSTVEVDAREQGRDGKPAFGVVQNMGASNVAPCKEAKRAAAAIGRHLRTLPEAEVSAYQDKLARTRSQERQDLGAEGLLRRRTGYDPFDRERLEAAWTGLQEFLPKAVRKKGLDALVSAHMPKEKEAATRNREPDQHIPW